MIIEDIKNSIRSALNKEDDKVIFYFEEIYHTGFPYAVLSLKDFKIEPCAQYDRQRCEFEFELCYMKSEENKIYELLEGQNMLKKALMPALAVKNKKITLDEVNFSVENKKLIMKFKMVLYVSEQDTSEQMQTLDITIKENNNAG